MTNDEGEQPMKANVPNLAKIVHLLGGFAALEPGQSFIISLDHEQIIRPKPDYSSEDLAIIFPDIRARDHRFKPLHIGLFWDNGDTYSVHVSLAAEAEGDVFRAILFDFVVPKTGWDKGQWEVAARQSDCPYLPGFNDRAADSPDIEEQIAREATEFDRDSIIVAACLRLIEKTTVAA
jgi:hypothetical protein